MFRRYLHVGLLVAAAQLQKGVQRRGMELALVHDQAVAAAEIHPLQRNRRHGALLDGLLHQVVGQHRHPQIRLHRPHQRLGAHALPGGLDAHAPALHQAVEQIPPGASLFPQQHVLHRQHLRRYPAEARVGMAGAAHQHQPVAAVGLRLNVGAVHLPLHQAQVNLVVQHHPGDGVGVVHLDLYLHLGIQFLEPAHILRQKAGGNGDAGPHPQRTRFALAADRVLRLLHQVHQVFGILVHLLARRGHIQVLGVPLEHPYPVVFLQFPQSHADGGLGDEQLLGGGGGAAGLVDAQKDLQMPQSHTIRLPFRPVQKPAIYSLLSIDSIIS